MLWGRHGNTGDLGPEDRGNLTPAVSLLTAVQRTERRNPGVLGRRGDPGQITDASDCTAPGLGGGIGAVVTADRHEPAGEAAGVGGERRYAVGVGVSKPGPDSARICVPRGGGLDVLEFGQELRGISRRAQVVRDELVEENSSGRFNDLMPPRLGSTPGDLRRAMRLPITEGRERKICRTGAARLFRSRESRARDQGEGAGSRGPSPGESSR